MLKKFILITSLIPAIALISCSAQQLTYESINRSLGQTADKIDKERSRILRLDKEGAPGYYYIIDKSGQVIYHPRKSLIGKDFSRYPFVKKILEERNGSFAMETGGTNTSVFYKELSDGSVLCYTIESSRYTIDRQ